MDISVSPGKIKRALNIAGQFPLGKKFNHFSFIFRRNKILSIGQNYPDCESPKALYFANKFNIGQLKKYPMLHSEIDAVSKLLNKVSLANLTMINIRLSATGLQTSKPCYKCSPILKAFNLSIIYSTRYGFYEL